MRLVGSALLLALLGASALADDAKPADAKPVETRAKVPLRVVRMLPEAHQALLFDRTKGTYVVVEVGQTVEGLTVDAIDSDEVDLLSDGGALVVLAAPAQMRHRRSAGEDDDEAVAPVKPGPAATAPAATAPAATAPAAASTAAASTAKAEPQPADPYAASSEAQPSDPYADPVQVVDTGSSTASSLGSGKDGVRVVEAPGTPAVAIVTPAPAAAASPAPATPAVPTASPPATASSRDADEGAAIAALMTASPAPTAPAMATTTATTPPATATPAATAAPGPTVLARADVNAALGNFGALAAAIHGGFTADGLRIDAVAAGSLFAKAGLRAGDVVTSVDGHPLHSLDDAANLYARAPGMKAATASVVRGGKPVTLRVSIQ